jgi:hypothetical protein
MQNQGVGAATEELEGNVAPRIFQPAVIAHTERILRPAKLLPNEMFAEWRPERLVTFARNRKLCASEAVLRLSIMLEFQLISLSEQY